jgi:glycosyltransferase involved in cell wall biosynthesis
MSVQLSAGLAPLQACVVIPARNEEARIGACLEALATQRDVAPAAFEVLLVLDACTDQTEGRAAEVAAEHPQLRLRALHGAGQGVGAARKLGMDLAAQLLIATGNRHGLIASTDADTIVAPDWLHEQLALVHGGAQAIGGAVHLGSVEGIDEALLERRRARSADRFATVLARDPTAEHHHFAGASMSLTADAYVTIGGMEPLVALEDEALERRLSQAGIPIERPAGVRVRTAPRLSGRAPRGLARDLALDRWLAERTYDGEQYPVERLLAARRASGDTVSVILPAKECAQTLPAILRHVVELRAAGVVDEILVVDAASGDGTAAVAAAEGVDVAQENELLPRFGPARGKGDAMWRGLSATSGDVVVYLDADSTGVESGFVRGILGPLLCHPELILVKGAFSRPFDPGDGGAEIAHGGGRVTELMARPLINLHVPELAGFEQPLAGEIAARRSLLEQLSFPVGYGVEIAMLIDALHLVGINALGQVRLGTRRNRHQSLRDLGAMAYAVMVAAERRLDREPVPGPYVHPVAQPDGGLTADARPVAVDERPPLTALGTLTERPARRSASR